MLKKQDEIVLQGLATFQYPKPHLEQYPTPPDLAVKFLNLAYEDIKDKVVFDLGCGTGILSIGSAILGARMVVGVDIDILALKVAKKNLEAVMGIYGELKVYFVNADIRELEFRADTVVMNPPFGMQRRGADRDFIVKAIKGSKVVWTLLGVNSDPFLESLSKIYGFKFEKMGNFILSIKRSMKFHKREIYRTRVSIYRLTIPT